MTERDALLCLNAVPGLGTIRIGRLISQFKTAGSVWKQNSQSLRTVVGIGDQIAGNISNFDSKDFLTKEKEFIERHGVTAVTLFDDDYPNLLREISDPPVVLYISGQKECLGALMIAIVGSRRASFYGISVAETFARDLVYAGVVVVSGMARGIDTAAHDACLEAGGKTIAVLGSGLADIYPKENRKLAIRIAQQGGCVISEFPMTASPMPQYFPRRNRIISGLSSGVIVVEASAKSGALITAQTALDQGRDVYAVPGKVGQHQAVGTNKLIQQGAKLVMSVDDVLDEFKWRPDFSVKATAYDPVSEFSSEEKKIFSVLSDDPIYIDEIIEKTGLKDCDVSSILLQWECQGRIKRLAGQYFIINSKSQIRNTKES